MRLCSPRAPPPRPHRPELPGPSLRAAAAAGPGSRRATQRRGPTPLGETTEVTCLGCGRVFSPRLAQPTELGPLSTAQAHGPRSAPGFPGVGTSGSLQRRDPAPGAARPHPSQLGLGRRPPAGGARGEPARGAEPRCRAPAAPCPPPRPELGAPAGAARRPASAQCPELPPPPEPRLPAGPGRAWGWGRGRWLCLAPAPGGFAAGAAAKTPARQGQGYFTSSSLVFHDSVALLVRKVGTTALG